LNMYNGRGKQSYTFFIVNIDEIQQRGKMFEFLQCEVVKLEPKRFINEKV
jgi:hypothetical protein